jgi:hypothetical protein
MAKTVANAKADPLELTDAEAQSYFDAEVRDLLGISGEEFLRRLDAGEYLDMPDDAEHADIVSLATFQCIGRGYS